MIYVGVRLCQSNGFGGVAGRVTWGIFGDGSSVPSVDSLRKEYTEVLAKLVPWVELESTSRRKGLIEYCSLSVERRVGLATSGTQAASYEIYSQCVEIGDVTGFW